MNRKFALGFFVLLLLIASSCTTEKDALDKKIRDLDIELTKVELRKECRKHSSDEECQKANENIVIKPEKLRRNKSADESCERFNVAEKECNITKRRAISNLEQLLKEKLAE